MPQKNQASAVSAYQRSAQRMPVVILLWKFLSPQNLECKFVSKVCFQLVDLDTNLLHGVTVTDSNCSVILRFEVVSDAVRSTDLILSSVTFTDVSTVIVLAVVFLA